MGTLRFLLTLSVVIAHSSPLFGLEIAGSVSAVQGFYIVSGFLISMILHEKYSSGAEGLRLFYSNRALRIFPTYWTIFLIAVIAPPNTLLLWRAELPNLNWSTAAYLIWSNIALIGIDGTLFLKLQNGALELTPNFRDSNPSVYSFLFVPQAWTLGIELAVYAIAPFLFRRSIATLLVVAGLSFLLRAMAFELGYRDDPWNYRFMPFELGLFVLGSLSYRASRVFRDSAFMEKLALPTFVFMVVLSFGYNYLPSESSWLPGFINAQVIYLGAIAMMLPALFVWSRAHPFDRWLGDLSYPLYLCHLIVIQCGGTTGLGRWFPIASSLLLVTGSVLLAILLMFGVDNRVNRFRQARVSKVRPGNLFDHCGGAPKGTLGAMPRGV